MCVGHVVKLEASSRKDNNSILSQLRYFYHEVRGFETFAKLLCNNC